MKRPPTIVMQLQLLLALAVFVFIAVQVSNGMLLNTAASSWDAAEGEIVSIRPKDRQCHIRYRFRYANEFHQGSEYAFLSHGTISDKQEILAAFHEGQEVTVRVNPKRPEQSVLVVRMDPFNYIAGPAFILLATAVFAGSVLWSLSSEGTRMHAVEEVVTYAGTAT
jgi:hypothetical protein